MAAPQYPFLGTVAIANGIAETFNNQGGRYIADTSAHVGTWAGYYAATDSVINVMQCKKLVGATRTVTDGVLNGTTTITSATASFASTDVDAYITGNGIPDDTYIVTVTNGTTAVLNKAATRTATGVSITIQDSPTAISVKAGNTFIFPGGASSVTLTSGTGILIGTA